jgi:hypothetical protein
MSQISKQALIVDNSQSFPNNNVGDITPSDLRAFNVNMIDSLVNEIPYQSFTASVTNSINLLNAFTASQQPVFNSLNSFTASQLTINTGYNAATYSLNASVNSLTAEVDQLQIWSGSVNQIQSAGVTKGYATRFNFSGLMTASITANVNGAIADISLVSDNTRVSTSSFNAYTQSTDAAISNLNQFTASQIPFNNSATASIVQLLSFSSSLDTGYVTEAELSAVSTSLNNNINTKLNTSSFNSFTQSVATAGYATTGSNTFIGNQTISGSLFISGNINMANGSDLVTHHVRAAGSNGLELQNASSGIIVSMGAGGGTQAAFTGAVTANSVSASSFTGLGNLTTFSTSVDSRLDITATTGSNSFTGSQTITGSITITGSAYGNVVSASIVSSTASIDLSTANYFTLTIASDTNINVINSQPGVTATLVINTAGAVSASFSSNVKQSSGSFYVPSISGNIDILSFTAVTPSTVYVVPAYTFV